MMIWFDLDGTLADLYGVENWLPMIQANDPTPYMVARPLVNLSALARTLHRLQKQGHEIGVISWTSKTGTPDYNAAVTAAKYAWLAKHLPSVDFDEIHVVPYGTPKQVFCRTPADVLFDDEQPNRDKWTGVAFDADNILVTLRAL